MLFQILMDPAEQPLALCDLSLCKSRVNDLCHLPGHRQISLPQIPGLVCQGEERFSPVALVWNTADQARHFHTVDHTGQGCGGKTCPVRKLSQ